MSISLNNQTPITQSRVAFNGAKEDKQMKNAKLLAGIATTLDPIIGGPTVALACTLKPTGKGTADEVAFKKEIKQEQVKTALKTGTAGFVASAATLAAGLAFGGITLLEVIAAGAIAKGVVTAIDYFKKD